MQSLLDEHHLYLADTTRLEAYRAAVAKAVSPGATVADVGCGSGVLGLLCLQAGARRVYAIDDSAMIEMAHETMVRAGWGDRVSCIRGKASQIELPERVDVAICDHVGYFGFDYGIVDLMGDARRRFLKPNGIVIPSTIQLLLAPIESERCHAMASSWLAENIIPEFRWLHGLAINTKRVVFFQHDEILGPPVNLGAIDLNANNGAYFAWNVDLQIERDGSMHGLGGWFDCQLAAGVWMTNSPVADNPIKRPQVFLPFGEAVEVKAGDIAKCAVMVRPEDHLISWTVDFPASGRRFSHSTWKGMILASEDIIRVHPGRIPKLSRRGSARNIVLGYCDGKRTAQEIQQAVLRDHPELFPSPAAITKFVVQVLGLDTE